MARSPQLLQPWTTPDVCNVLQGILAVEWTSIRPLSCHCGIENRLRTSSMWINEKDSFFRNCDDELVEQISEFTQLDKCNSTSKEHLQHYGNGVSVIHCSVLRSFFIDRETLLSRLDRMHWTSNSSTIESIVGSFQTLSSKTEQSHSLSSSSLKEVLSKSRSKQKKEVEEYCPTTTWQRSDLDLTEQCNWQSNNNHSRQSRPSCRYLRRERHDRYSDGQWTSPDSPQSSFFAQNVLVCLLMSISSSLLFCQWCVNHRQIHRVD